MTYKQLITPDVNIGASAGYCLGYVDNAIGAVYPYRSDTAQIAYNTAKVKGWVTANQNYPKNVWFVMFWSIDNGAYKGLGHVALGYVDNAGNLQIHDSEVHRGARSAYRSLADLAGWFGSVGTRLTYLGWSIGCDNVKLIEEIKETTITTNTIKKGETATMYAIYWIPNQKGTGQDAYFFNGVSYEYINHPDVINILKKVYKDNNSKDIPEYHWQKSAPWWNRIQQPVTNLQDLSDKVDKIAKKVGA